MRKILALAFSAVLLLVIHIQGGEGQKSLRKWKNNNLAVCNENCRGSTCDDGQTCRKISHPKRGYDCFECRECVNMKKYIKELMPNEAFKLNEECLHIRIQCAACPDCANTLAHVGGQESPESSEFFVNGGLPTVWSVLGISVVVNLLLLSLLINCGRRKKPQEMNSTRRAEEGYEAMTGGIEMTQQQ